MVDKDKEKETKAEKKQDKKDAKAEKKQDKQDAKAEKKQDKQDAKAEKKQDKQDAKDKKNADKAAAKAAKPAKPAGGRMQAFKDKFNFMKRKKNAKAKAKAKAKKQKKEEPKVPFVDKPSKVEKPSIYIHKVVKLDNKNNKFTQKQFQEVHQLSKSSDVIESFHRIGMLLNNVNLADLPKDNCDKICFILINNYRKDSDSLGVGPLNDAYLFAKIHIKLGYKIVFLFNPDKLAFIKTLEFFLKNTMTALTIYYSGRDSSSRNRKTSHGIQFNGQNIVYSSTEFGQLVADNSNGQAKILVISDCGCGGSVFSMKAASKTENTHCSQIVAFSSNKKDLEPKERRRSQGLFTYYFCKLIRQFPKSSPKEMTEMLNMSCERFGVVYNPLYNNDDVADQPIYPEAEMIFTGQVTPSANAGPAADKPTTEAIPVQSQ